MVSACAALGATSVLAPLLNHKLLQPCSLCFIGDGALLCALRLTPTRVGPTAACWVECPGQAIAVLPCAPGQWVSWLTQHIVPVSAQTRQAGQV
jgi:hypothetical protein